MLKLYNTLTRKKEVFKPRKGKKVDIFVCGPTVYDFSHLGHARTYIFYDMFVSYLRTLGYKIFYLQNITDIDDKIIQKAKEKKQNWKELSRFFEKEYLNDMRDLDISSVDKYARATEHIKEIQSQIERLLEKGFAYEIEGDGIYYDIKKFKGYGKLSKRTAIGSENATSRIDQSLRKRNKGDFCLWKYSRKGEPSWPFDSSLGSSLRTGLPAGRPGWHIEDTAISEKYFGPQYDIHGGAQDLVFPHHEAEIAQMEAISGKPPLVKYWVHTGFLTVEGRKMAKSLGNFITVKDFLKKYQSEVLRFLTFSAHYRSPLNYSEKLAQEAQANLEKLQEFLGKLKDLRGSIPRSSRSLRGSIPRKLEGFGERFWAAMEDDFNAPKAKGLIFDFVSKTNRRIGKNQVSLEEAKEIYNFFKKINHIFKFLNFGKIEKKEKIPKEIEKLVEKREKLREEKKWQEADTLRKRAKKLGYQIEDTSKGPRIKQVD